MKIGEGSGKAGEKKPPFWSVMVPAYNPRPDYLEKALRSVLDQDPGPDQMQIEVIDDCSPSGSLEPLVRKIGGERVRFLRSPSNLGLAGNWNKCIAQAEGQWVHILHQDDLVLPGYYARLRPALESHPTVGAAFCRHAYIDGDGHWTCLSELEEKEPGIIKDFYVRLGEQQRMQFPSVVVQKAIYQKVGPFRSDLVYVLDWEMWLRVSLQTEVWYEPAILACYRNHNSSTTMRLARKGDDVRDVAKFLKMAEHYLPAGNRRSTLSAAKEHWACKALYRANAFAADGEIRAAANQLRAAWQLQPSPRLVRDSLKLILKIVAGVGRVAP